MTKAPRSSAIWRRYEASPDSARAVAAGRLEKLHAVDELVQSGMSRSKAITDIAQRSDTSRATLYRWWCLVKDLHRSDWLAALVPAHGGRECALPAGLRHREPEIRRD